MAANLFSSPEEEREWVALIARYNKHTPEARNIILSHYNRLRDNAVFRVADLRAAIELVEFEGEQAAAKLSADEYEDIIKGEEIYGRLCR